MKEDNTFVIKGPPPLAPIPEVSVGKLIYDRLLSQFNENEALVDAVTEESLSYKDILQRTCALAESLAKSGYGKNTVITICSENCIEFFIPVIAALYIGAIVAPVSHNYTRAEIVHALSISKPNLVFCSEQVLPKFLELKETLTHVEKIIILEGKNKDEFAESMDSFVDRCLCGRTTLYRFNIPQIQSTDDVAVILCSSGTTGLPKGVMVTHKNILTKFMHNEDPRFTSQKKGRCTFGVLPFFHSYGMFISLNSIYRSIKIVVVKKFEEHLFLRTVERYKITSLSLVPSLALFLAKTPLVDKYDISSIVEVSCGAAPLSKNTEEVLKNKLKINCVQQAYGLTETTLRVVGLPPGEEKFGSSGKLLPYMLAKVRDPDTGKSLGPNQTGELCFKGPLIAKGYYRNEEATRSSFTANGWFLTGDLGYYDQEGYFYVVDRLKELVKYKGYQVPPAELEAVLLSNPKIADAAVVGLPDEEAGELPLAFVVSNTNSNLTEEEVKQFVAEKVSPPKRLRGGVIFVSEIPKGPSGKILRRRLRDSLKTLKSKL